MKRKNVAVYVADIYRDIVRKTQYGVIQAAKRNNVKLFFFTSFSDNYSNMEFVELSDYDKGDFSIYMLPDLEHFDGLISFDSYMPENFNEPVNRLKEKAACPVVTLGDIKDFTYNVVNDQKRSYMELIEHIIVDHNCKELIHVAGRMSMSFAVERMEVFKNTLTKHGISYDESNIVYGNLWYSCGDDMVAQILAKYENNPNRILPDAIICANDYMAMGVVTALEKKGYSIPEDVIVTGYDNVIQAEYHDPSITTSSQPFEQVGKDAINILTRLWAGKDVPQTTAEPGIIMRRQTCGCEPKKTYKADNLRESYSVTIEKLGLLSNTITNLILSVSTAQTDEDIFNKLEANCRKDTGFKTAVLCLMDKWDQQVEINYPNDFADVHFDVVCGIHNDMPVKRERLPKGQILPTKMLEDPEPYYIVPIHHLKYFMGYYIISPDLEELSQANIKSWFINISTILENWRLKKELKSSFEKLQNLSVTDVLTHLYNRRAYNIYFEDYYKSSRISGTSLAVFLIDMDNMKKINDSYGHDEGDYCLCTIANAMTNARQKDEICIRSGGDEFVVLARDYTIDMAENYIKELRSYISERCTEDNKPFEISVSIGCYMRQPDFSDKQPISVISEDYLREADKLMYEEKKKHKELG